MIVMTQRLGSNRCFKRADYLRCFLMSSLRSSELPVINPKMMSSNVIPAPAKIAYGDFQKLGRMTITSTPVINPYNGIRMLWGISLHAFVKEKGFRIRFSLITLSRWNLRCLTNGSRSVNCFWRSLFSLSDSDSGMAASFVFIIVQGFIFNDHY